MIYFQVIDRNIRNFLNALMPRLPFHVAAGETPPGLTDFVIFYDPLVNPTRPGRILPAGLVSLLEEGKPMEAERILIGVIVDALDRLDKEVFGVPTIHDNADARHSGNSIRPFGTSRRGSIRDAGPSAESPPIDTERSRNWR